MENNIKSFSDFANEKTEANKAEALKEAQTEYAKKFAARLEEFGVKSPSELSDDKKKEFFAGLKEALEAIQAIDEAGMGDVKDNGDTTVNQVKVDPSAMSSQPASKEDEAMQSKVGEPTGSDGAATAKAIEKETVAMGEPTSKADDMTKQGEDVTGDDDGTAAPTTNATVPAADGATGAAVESNNEGTEVESNENEERIGDFIEKFFEFMSEEELDKFTELDEETEIIAMIEEIEEKYSEEVAEAEAEAAAAKELEESFETPSRRIPTFEDFMSNRG